MRVVCVLPCIAALATSVFAAPQRTNTPDSGSSTAHTVVFNAMLSSPTTVTPATATDLVRLVEAEAPRSFAFWTVLDLEMLTVRERVESSPLLLEGMVSAPTDLSAVLALN